MELEEMKNAWTEMSAEIEKQKKLTDKLIMMMTQEKYTSTLGKIKTPEMLGTVISFALALLILINFDKYDTVYLIACSIISMIILVALPILSLNAIQKMSRLNIQESNYKQILTDYAKGKRKFLSVQKLSFYLGFMLMITTLPVMLKIMGGKNDHVETSVWFWFLPVGSLFFIVFARWVYGYYVNTTVKVENLLKELAE